MDPLPGSWADVQDAQGAAEAGGGVDGEGAAEAHEAPHAERAAGGEVRDLEAGEPSKKVTQRLIDTATT